MSRPATISPSQFKRIIAKQGLGAGAETYAWELVQQLLGVPIDTYTSFEMQWGIDNEPFAIELYETIKFVEVERSIRRYHPKYDYISGEVDGLIGTDGIVEIKCPSSANHLKNLAHGEQLSLYMTQIQGYLWIFERDWCDFVSYDPRFPKDEHKISIHHVKRDEDVISLLEERCTEFWEAMVLPKLELLNNIKK